MRNWLRPLLLLIIPLLFLWPTGAAAQDDPAVQTLTGRVEAGDITLYLLPDLQAGDVFTARMRTTSGNLDPIVGVISGDVDPTQFEADYGAALAEALASGVDPLVAVNDVRDDLLLAWDDDSGGGLSPALRFEVPADGDYRLLAAGALSLTNKATFGDFELTVGLNAEDVLAGTAEPTGDEIAFLDREATPPRYGAQVIDGTLRPERPLHNYTLADFRAEEMLYARVEATEGDWQPQLLLRNFAAKPLADGVIQEPGVATLTYAFATDQRNGRLTVLADGGEEAPVGSYRLFLGANELLALTGEVSNNGRSIAREPIQVQVGMRLEQMIDLVQNSEFFQAAAALRLEWRDPALAFNPESCECDNIVLNGGDIDAYFSDPTRRFPLFSIPNQQGNRWIQNRGMRINSDGDALYFERFTTNFQVDFDFSRYPFDEQTFFMRLDLLPSEEEFQFVPLPGFSVISPDNGEDEFIFSEPEVTISSVLPFSGAPFSRYQFTWSGPRELEYYWMQIFVPILLIIVVSWFTFFLKDYVRRIEVASANLLLFIAFSFSLADNYPRLGYLTFLDAVMVIMFVTNALVVVYNVWMRRLEMQGNIANVERVDDVMDWLFPLIYVALLGLLILYFF